MPTSGSGAPKIPTGANWVAGTPLPTTSRTMVSRSMAAEKALRTSGLSKGGLVIVNPT